MTELPHSQVTINDANPRDREWIAGVAFPGVANTVVEPPLAGRLMSLRRTCVVNGDACRHSGGERIVSSASAAERRLATQAAQFCAKAVQSPFSYSLFWPCDRVRTDAGRARSGACVFS